MRLKFYMLMDGTAAAGLVEVTHPGWSYVRGGIVLAALLWQTTDLPTTTVVANIIVDNHSSESCEVLQV